MLLIATTLIYAPSRSYILTAFSAANQTPSPTALPISTPTSTSAAADPSIMATQIGELRSEVNALQQQVNTLSQPQAIPTAGTQQPQMSSQVTALEGRIEVIEQAILDNPSKSLALTLLNHDMDNLQREVDRMYDLNKWFVGLLIPMALSLLGLAISNFISKPVEKPERRDKQKETPPKNE